MSALHFWVHRILSARASWLKHAALGKGGELCAEWEVGRSAKGLPQKICNGQDHACVQLHAGPRVQDARFPYLALAQREMATLNKLNKITRQAAGIANYTEVYGLRVPRH